MPASDPLKELRLLFAFFGEAPPACDPIESFEVPDPYRKLLVHDKHMTVTLEEHFGSPVVLHAYQVHHQGNMYGRKLDLRLASDGRVVMTGVMLFNFHFVSEKVRDLILEQKTPLGRILIENNVLRRISGVTPLRLSEADPLAKRFELASPQATYGRLATIFCDEKPAVDLLEIVRPNLT